MALTTMRDVRLGMRTLRKAPSFTITAALTLALGIGANTAIFSALNTVLLRPLPVKDADRVVVNVALRQGFDPFGSGLMDYAAYRDRSHSFEQCGVSVPRSFNLVEHGQPEHLEGAAIDAGYLRTLGVKPIVGRGFSAADDRPGGPALALISYGLWQHRFGADPGVVGRPLDLDGRAASIVGVLPRGFDLPAAAEIWTPLQADIYGLPLAERATHEYDMIARLKPGVSLASADLELKGIAQQLAREFPQVRSGWSVKAVELREQVLGDLNGRIKRALLALFAAIGFFLLICCVNVANLMLARGVTREREMAIRRALGADWRRLVAQLLTESSLLALAGGAGGLLLAYSILPLLAALNPIETVALAGVLGDIRIDERVLLFVAIATIVTALVCPLISILRLTTTNDPMRLIREGQRGTSGSGRTRWLAALAVIEVAIAVPLLVGGGLMIQSFAKLARVPLGFETGNRLAMHLELSAARYRDATQRIALEKRLLDAIGRVPGVLSAGITTNIPLSTLSYDSVFTVEGRTRLNPSDVPITAHRWASPAYLNSLGVRLVQGRLLNEHDTMASAPVVVISEELARQAWPGENPLGKRIRRGNQYQANFPWLTVVGVVANLKEDRDNFRIDRPVWYLPYEQLQQITQVDGVISRKLDLLIRAHGDPTELASAIRNALHSVDPDQPVSNVRTLKAHVASVIVSDRFNAILMGALAGLGLTLAMIGVYGVLSYSVNVRTAELGLRAALGASPPDILKMIAGGGARLIAVGLLAGLFGSIAFSRVLSGILYGVNPSDPATFGGVCLLLLAVALVACCLPAWRASRVDPLTALQRP